MKITSIEITSFGKFKNKTINFSDGLNIIAGNNESGKSTIINFIYAMLYGFGDNRGKGLSLREKYTPWDGGDCEGRLNIITDDGEPVTIYRKAGSVKKYDILKVYNTDTAAEVFASPESLVGVNSETFLRTVCVKQLSSAFEGSTSEIVTRLANITQSGDESINYERAMKILENAKREIRPQRGNGGTLSAVNFEISNLERAKGKSLETEKQLESLRFSLASVEKSAKKTEEEYEKALTENYDATIANIEGRISEKEAYIGKAEKSSSPTKLYIGACAIFVALGILMLILNAPLWFLPLIAALVPIILIFTEKKKTVTKKEGAELENLKKELSVLQGKKLHHEKQISLLKGNLDALKNTQTETKLRISSLESQAEFVDTSSLPALYEKRSALEKSFSVLALAADALESSHRKMQRNFTPTLNKNASVYFSELTDGRYSGIFTDEEFNLKINADLPRESAFFSGGTVDQLYLSLRIALIDMIFTDGSSFIILDQPFIQYDKNRKEKAMKLLASLPENRQIILFTSDFDEFSNNKNTEILT